MKHEEVFRALGDASRRRILKLLQRGSLNAGDIARHFDVSAPSVSHHLAVLKTSDLIRAERRGQNIVYSLNTSVVEDLAIFFSDILKNHRGTVK